MRSLKIPLVAVIFVVLAAGAVMADSNALMCNSITESSEDTIKVETFIGRPGDTVWLPIMIASDSIVSGFKALIRYEDDLMTPALDPNDPTYVLYELVGRFADAQSGLEDDIFSAAISQNPFDSGAIVAGFNIGFGENLVTMDPGSGVVFRLAFVSNASMQQNDLAAFWFHQVNEFWLDTLGEIHYADCRRSEVSLDFNNTSDSTTVVHYPTMIDGYFRVDTAPAPIIEDYYASPDTVPVSNTFSLNWAVQNADWVKTSGPNITTDSTTSVTGMRVVQAPSTEGDYQYIIVAGNEWATAEDTTILTVGSGGGGGGDENAPTISVNSAYSVDVGTTLTFTVSSTDANGDVITLEATSLPANATFTTVTGTSPVSSVFSFTPTIAQAGNVSASFKATDAGGLYSSRTVSIVVNEPEYDRLFTSSVYGAAVGGVPSKQGLTLPINLVTSQTVYGVQFDFLYDSENFEVTDVSVTENTAEYVVYEDIGANPGIVRFVTFGMGNQSIGSDGTDILNLEIAIDENALPGLYPVYIEEGWESIDPDPQSSSLQLVSDSGLLQVDAFGDVNLDTRINVADLVSIVGCIIGDYTFNERRMDIADIITDSEIDVFDLVAVVNLIYDIEVSPTPGYFDESKFATISLDYDDMFSGAEDVMTVRSELPTDIAGVELEIQYDPYSVELGAPTLSDDISGMALTSRDDGNGVMKALVYFTNPYRVDDQIGAGTVNMLQVPIKARSDIEAGDLSKVSLHRALLSTSNSMAVKVEGIDTPLPGSFVLSQNYPNPFNPTTTIQFSIDGSSGGSNVKLDVYNILGQNVKTLIDEVMSAGHHQVTWDGSDHHGKRVASGVYLYKLTVGQDSQTKKMLLLK
ncbi:MAG TPA: cohesin domain-containing protein [candidate division Zixibacteria bacterium]|nr:cohesin domain-containing protein [candidate division Zixibacteria bacterium]